MLKKVVFAGAALAVLASVPAQADDEKITYRQNMMKAVGGYAGAMGQIVQNKVPYSDDLADHARGLAAAATNALRAFEEAPEPGNGKSKPAVWDNWDDFSARMEGMIAAANEVAAAAEEGGMAAAAPKMRGMFVCTSCHNEYKND